MKSIADSIKDRAANDRQWMDEIIKGLVWLLIGVVVAGALVYAGVRSYSLFIATIAPEWHWLVPVGVLTTEISAIALPLAYHYACAPGRQRNWVKAFTVVDITFIICNCILDAARESGYFVPEAFKLYGVFVLPALPAICLVGWLVFAALSDASKHRDMVAIVQSNTRETLLSHIQEAISATDVTEAVQAAANEYSRALVAQTLGNYQAKEPSAQIKQVRLTLPPTNGHSFNAELPETVKLVEPAPKSKGGKAG